NRVFTFAHGQNLNDILTGYRAFTLDSIRQLHLQESGFGIETEMTVEGLKHEQKLLSVPITYKPRPEESRTNLHPIRDGARIAYTIYDMTKTNNPLFYFGTLGGFLFLLGLLTGFYVTYDWYVNSISHEVLAVLTALFIIAGIQLFIFASLSDMIVKLHREQMREMGRRFTDLHESEED
ncbi:MAG: TIGR04182 family glycosyltransferase, partial [Halobacteria archaeon]|nr:TIGR04182 family glycosyltransferase [Halobacteria archaeon]